MADSMFDKKCTGCQQLMDLAKIVGMLTEDEFNKCISELQIEGMRYNPYIRAELKKRNF